VAQAVTSNAASSAGSVQGAGLGLGFKGNLLVLVDPCLLDAAVGGGCAGAGGHGLGAVFGGLAALGLDLGAQIGGAELRALQAPGLHAGQG
jgi:hypothetical protein